MDFVNVLIFRDIMSCVSSNGAVGAEKRDLEFFANETVHVQNTKVPATFI